MDFDIVYGNTRARAMKNRLFKKNDYDAALKSQNLQEFITLLEHTGYRVGIERLKEQTRESINHKLGENLVAELDRLKFLAPNSLKGLFDVFRERYELENFKTLLAFKINGRNGDVWAELPYPVKNHKLMAQLVEAELGEAVRILAEKIPEFKKAYSIVKEKGSTQPIFLALEKYYFEKLWNNLGRRQKAARALVGEEMDLLNLLNVLRASKQGIDIRSFLLPSYRLDTSPLIKNWVPDQFLREAGRCGYKRYLEMELSQAESEMKKHMVERYRKAIGADSYDPAALLGYLRVKEQEVWNLITICNSLGRLKKEEIEELIF